MYLICDDLEQKQQDKHRLLRISTTQIEKL